MSVYQPSELRHFLDQLGISPKKALSQNFLIDGNIIRKIAAAADLTQDDVVMEIGSGPGALTQELLKTGATVVAVEKDKVLAEELKRLKAPDNRLEIFQDDIMTFPMDTILKKFLPKDGKAKVIGNLPYHLTTPIIAQLVTMDHLFSSIVIMVQKEVADRLTASPDNKHYSSFTVFLNYYSTPKYAFTVSRNCFYPKPKVDSAIVVLELHKPPKVSNQEKFFILTRTSFEHRRKMLRASLRDIYSPEKVMSCLERIGQNPLARPEVLSLDEFLRLFELLEDSN